MSGKIITTLILSGLFTTLISHADTTSPVTTTPTPSAPITSAPATSSDTPVVMSKDKWLNSMTPMLPDLICKGFIQDKDLKKRFDEIKMNYEQCASLIPASAKKCQEQLYANIPEQINASTAGTWGKTLGECIGRDFAEQYLVPKN